MPVSQLKMYLKSFPWDFCEDYFIHPHSHIYLFIYVFESAGLLSPGWLGTCDSPVSASWLGIAGVLHHAWLHSLTPVCVGVHVQAYGDRRLRSGVFFICFLPYWSLVEPSAHQFSWADQSVRSRDRLYVHPTTRTTDTCCCSWLFQVSAGDPHSGCLRVHGKRFTTSHPLAPIPLSLWRKMIYCLSSPHKAQEILWKGHNHESGIQILKYSIMNLEIYLTDRGALSSSSSLHEGGKT